MAIVWYYVRLPHVILVFSAASFRTPETLSCKAITSLLCNKNQNLFDNCDIKNIQLFVENVIKSDSPLVRSIRAVHITSLDTVIKRANVFQSKTLKPLIELISDVITALTTSGENVKVRSLKRESSDSFNVPSVSFPTGQIYVFQVCSDRGEEKCMSLVRFGDTRFRIFFFKFLVSYLKLKIKLYMFLFFSLSKLYLVSGV